MGGQALPPTPLIRMAWAAYKIVSRHGFEPLESHGWLHALKGGQITILDFNQEGDRGPLLHLFMGVDRPNWTLASANEPHPLPPDRAHEDLVIWLMENGADPWVRHEGKNAWSEAIYRGWPSVLRYLKNRPDAPPREVLEQEAIFRNYNWPGNTGEVGEPLTAPAAFAERNQIDALMAWAGLGFSVNLDMDKPHNAGTRARTPEFLEAWASLGGDIRATTPQGKPLKDAWRSFAAAHQVAMERVWSKYNPQTDRPLGDRIREVLNLVHNGSSKTLVAHRMRDLEVSPDSLLEDGTPMWEAWVNTRSKTPPSGAPAVVSMLLEHAPQEIYWQAMVEGLQGATKAFSQSFPTSRQLESIVESKKFGPVSQVLYRLADEVMAYPNAMGRLFHLSRKFPRSVLMGVEELGVEAEPSSQEDMVDFWAKWFFRVDPNTGRHHGWPAFAAWVEMGEEDVSWDPIYSSLLSSTGKFSEQAALGVDLMMVAQARRDVRMGRFPQEILEQWESGGTMGWLEGYDLQKPGGVDLETVAKAWESLSKRSSPQVRQSIQKVLTMVKEKAMDARMPAPSPTAKRAAPSRF